jgi:hypothetical protein
MLNINETILFQINLKELIDYFGDANFEKGGLIFLIDYIPYKKQLENNKKNKKSKSNPD